MGDKSPAPNVEMLYTMGLPSGADYTFVLKRAENGKGLQFTNDNKVYDNQDKKVIRGIYKAIQDRSIGEILASTNIDSPPIELRSFIDSPRDIKDLALFNKYDQTRIRSTWEKLAAKSETDRINTANERNATNISSPADDLKTNRS